MPNEQNYEVAFIATPSDEALSPQAEQLLNRIQELEEMLAAAEVFRISKDVTIERRSENKWSVCTLGETLNKVTKEWEYEQFPSKRSERYLSENRFDSYKEAKEAFYELEITER